MWCSKFKRTATKGKFRRPQPRKDLQAGYVANWNIRVSCEMFSQAAGISKGRIDKKRRGGRRERSR